MPETSEEKLAPQTRDVKLPQGLEEVLAFKSKWATQQVRLLKLFLVCSKGGHVTKRRYHAKCPQFSTRGGRGSKLSKVRSTYLNSRAKLLLEATFFIIIYTYLK